MQTTGEDYYDIPDDELPSANFAARPTREISELGLLVIDGLWTFTSFASSSFENTDGEDDTDDGPTPTTLTPETPLMPQPEMPRTLPDTPAITVTSLSRRQSLRQGIRSVGDVVAIVRRPSMRQKANTALPSAFNSTEYAPQDAARGRHLRHLSSKNDSKARKVLGIDERLLEKEVVKPMYSTDECEEEEKGTELLQANASFSRKSRVRETLERKQLARLRMDFVESEPDKSVDSPQSMLGTPVELYATPERQPGRFRPTSAIYGRRGTSTPVSPKTPSRFQRPQPRSDGRFAGDEDLEDLYQTRIYVPGPIHLEKHPALLRKDSVATLDPFASETDSIVVYFDGIGLIEEATDECLDRYWLNGQQQALQETDLDVMELEPLSPRSQQSSNRRMPPACSRSRQRHQAPPCHKALHKSAS
ncbi:hypothetical protein BU25DRAFT_414997 [Macroventuria anomochaeta]|uniref:Uncharacterized protein n=1 Tax=Macroventuria anomochaeta TaxID=301207 RepID=A0ACB6RP89_9PLEO|nr:uncharacterized protein BU25DRAFT_414997 [Macroventuria anomochaeta]KAF2622747.1 hypothetical protein BU25DRAFT_414997 [Macroventuria anomochaeta]